MSDVPPPPPGWPGQDPNRQPPSESQPTPGWGLVDHPPGYQSPYPPGQQQQYPTYAPAQQTSGLAIASLVCSLVWLCGLGSLLAVIFGLISIKQINASQGRMGGKGLAIAGTIIGALGVVLLAAWIVLVVVATSSSRTLTLVGLL